MNRFIGILIMRLSKNMTLPTMTAAALVMGLSLPVCAATGDVETDQTTAHIVSKTTKVVSTTTHPMAKHNAQHHHSKMTKAMDVKQDGANSAKKVMMKNGVILNDVEPTAESQSSPFGVPTSTDDTLKGGITSTIAPTAMN